MKRALPGSSVFCIGRTARIGCGIALLLLGACADSEPTLEQPRAAAGLPQTDHAVDLRIDTVAAGLDTPWDVAFAPDGRIFVTERPGRVRVVNREGLVAEPWASFNVFQDADWLPEAGLMGIALDPEFATTGYVYVAATFDARGRGPLAAIGRRIRGLFGNSKSTQMSRVLRLRDRNGSSADLEVLIDSLPAAPYHAGGALAFGPDGMLYVSVGDGMVPERAQKFDSRAGKILRFTPEGRIPADNPVPGSAVFALGFRNVQGIAWDKHNRHMFATDHGPTGMIQEGGRFGRDELNLVRPGGNYGWPREAGMHDTRSPGNRTYVTPVLEWNPAIAPGALAFYDGSLFPWYGDLLVGSLRGQQLRRVSLRVDSGIVTAVAEGTVLERSYGRIRAVRLGPAGEIYVTTSNRDGRGTPGPADDLLLKLSPRD